MCAKKAKLTHILAHSQPRYSTHSVPPRTALDMREHRYNESTAARREPCRHAPQGLQNFPADGNEGRDADNVIQTITGVEPILQHSAAARAADA